MKLMLLLTVVFLSGCATKSIVLSTPSVPPELLQRCPDVIADPLTTADQYDTARALAQAAGNCRACAARQSALVDALEVRESIMRSVQQQLQENR